MTTAGYILGFLMVFIAVIHQIPAPTPKPRRRSGGIGYNRKARR